jgi:[ribosomal protein S5]-alanine N-acetyltransferase
MTPWLPLETERLRLREFRAGDEADIHEFASDVEVVRFAHWGPNDFATTRAYLADRLEEQRQWPRDSVDIAVELQSDRRLIGTMRLTILDGHNRTADFGFTFSRPYWNQGYATEGARALLQVGFLKLGVHRMWASCDARNHASYRVMEKLGMRREALFQKDVFQKGEWRDSYLYAILAEEWQAAGPS